MSETIEMRRGPPPPDPTRPLGDAGSLLVVGMALVVLVALASAAIGWAPLAHRASSAVVLAVVAALVAWLAVSMAREASSDDRGAPRRWRLRLVVAGPALVLLVYAGAAFLLPAASRVEWFLNGDHVRHLVLVADERAQGSLSYERRNYPRAWHTNIAALWSVSSGSGGSRADIPGLIDLMATLTWLLSSALALATATLTVALGRRVGVSMVPTCFASATAAAATLWPSFLGNYQALGLESSLVAALVLAVCLRELLERLGSLAAFVVCAAGLLVMGHTWQLLLPVSSLAALAAGYAFARRGGLARIFGVLGVLVVVSIAIIPAITAIATTVGVAQAAVADIVAPVPVLGLALAVVAMAYLAWRHRVDRGLVAVLGLAVLPALTSLGIAMRVGVAVTSYYPAKLLWHTAALGLAPIGASAGILWTYLGGRALSYRVVGRGLMGAAGVLCVLGSIWAPSRAFSGAWSTADGATVLSLIRTQGADRAVVVWSDGGRNTDAITRIVLDGYKPAASRVDTRQRKLTVAEDCRLLSEASDPVILSNRPLEEVRARYTCAPQARVITP